MSTVGLRNAQVKTERKVLRVIKNDCFWRSFLMWWAWRDSHPSLKLRHGKGTLPAINFWWARQGSDLRPCAYKAHALPLSYVP